MEWNEGEHYDIIDTCWVWRGSKHKQGYGRRRHNGKIRPTHILMFEQFIGPIPEGMWVLHSCDNPPCINPAHLRAGTRQNNVDDMMSRGRNRPYGALPVVEDEYELIDYYRNKGYSHRKIADLLGVSHMTVGNYLRRNG